MIGVFTFAAHSAFAAGDKDKGGGGDKSRVLGKPYAIKDRSGGGDRDRHEHRWRPTSYPKVPLTRAASSKAKLKLEARQPRPAPKFDRELLRDFGKADKKTRRAFFELFEDDLGGGGGGFGFGFGRDREDDGGKDEGPDLLASEQPKFRQWQAAVKRDLVTPTGERLPVTYMEVGPADAAKPTIVHLHGAGVTPDNVLIYRLHQAYEAAGKPVRILSVRWGDAQKVVDEVYRTTGQKVIVSGHSAGAGMGSDIARHSPDKVSHFIGMGMNAFARKVPTLTFTGTNDIVPPGHMQYEASMDDNATSLILEGVDHSMRLGPGDGEYYKRRPSGEWGTKSFHNSTPESARVARNIVDSINHFIDGQDVNATFLKSKARDLGQGVFHGTFDK